MKRFLSFQKKKILEPVLNNLGHILNALNQLLLRIRSASNGIREFIFFDLFE